MQIIRKWGQILAKKIGDKTFECYSELIEYYETLKEVCEEVSIIALYDEAKPVVEMMISEGYDMYDITLCSCEVGGYVDEYCIGSVDNDLFCEEAKRDGKYYNICPYDCVALICADNVNDELLEHIQGKYVLYTVEELNCYYESEEESCVCNKESEETSCDEDTEELALKLLKKIFEC